MKISDDIAEKILIGIFVKYSLLAAM